MANTCPGGVSDDLTSEGYHVINDSRCNNMDIYPTKNEIRTNCKTGTNAFMVKYVLKKRVIATAITLINIMQYQMFT
jgi:hypothetical protein